MTHKQSKFRYILFLNLVVILYSVSVLFGKTAALEQKINFRFFLFYGITILFLGVFAFLWQIILKKVPLTLAFSNKAIVIFWGLLWGVLFFNEDVTFGKIFGIILVVLGVILFSISKSLERKSNVTLKKES